MAKLIRVVAILCAIFIWQHHAHAQAQVIPCSPHANSDKTTSCPPGTPPSQAYSLGYCQLSSLGSAVGLSSCSGGIPANAGIVIVQTESQAVRWRDDGTSPTSFVGMPLAVGNQLTYVGNLSKLQFIQQSSSATLDVTFYQSYQ